MKTTADKTTTTASASQNCEHQYRETEIEPIGATCVKCGDFARLKGTIPAEKPTDGLPEVNWVAISESHVEATKRAEAQAAQLAEALRDITHAVEQGRWIAFEACVAWSQKVLAAYEAAQ